MEGDGKDAKKVASGNVLRHQEYGTKECVFFLINCEQSMFEKNTGGIVPIDLAFTLLISWMENRVVQHPNEMIGIIFFNTKVLNNDNKFKGVYTFKKLGTLSAGIINAIQDIHNKIMENLSDLGKNAVWGGPGPAVSEGATALDLLHVLHDTLWETSRQIFSEKKIKKFYRCRINLLTCADDPCGGNDDETLQTLTKVEDMGRKGYSTELYFMNRKQNIAGGQDGMFQLSRFYDGFNSHNKTGLVEFFKENNLTNDDSESTEKSFKISSKADTLNRARDRYHSKRTAGRLCISIGDQVKIGAAAYHLFAEQKKPLKKNLHVQTNKEIISDRSLYCEDSGRKLQPSDYELYFVLGTNKKDVSSRVFFEKDEVSVQIKESHKMDPGCRVLGFRSKVSLKPYYQAKGSYFLYPDNSTLHGSVKAFTALHDAMVERNVVAIAMIRITRISSPRLAALIPQESVFARSQLVSFPPHIPVNIGDVIDAESGEGSGTVVRQEAGNGGMYWQVQLEKGSSPFENGMEVELLSDEDREMKFKLSAVMPPVLGNHTTPAGFQAVILPWANEIRKEEDWMPASIGQAEPNAHLVEHMENIVEDCDLGTYVPGQFRNPSLTRFYAVLKALALNDMSVEWSDEKHDKLRPPPEADEHCADDVKEILSLLPDVPPASSQKKRERAGASSETARKKFKSEAPLNWNKIYARSEVAKQTVPALKKFLKELGQDCTGRKSELVERVNKVLKEQLADL